MDGKRKGFLVALVIGVLAAPALALGGAQVFGAEGTGAAPAAASAVPAGSTAPALPATAEASEPNLAVACGPEAAILVAGEGAGTLSDVQQAALDALRPICAAAGFRAENGSWADADEATAAIGAAPGIAPAGNGGQGAAYHEDDQYEDDQYEDDHYEDDQDKDEDNGTAPDQEDGTEGHEVEGDD